MVTGVHVLAGNWTMRILGLEVNELPMFNWGYRELQLHQRPLWASSYFLSFTWQWPMKEPVKHRDADQILALVAAEGLSVPPLLYEVEGVMRDLSPELMGKSKTQKNDVRIEIGKRWQQLIDGFVLDLQQR